jgi:hypothetical protein
MLEDALKRFDEIFQRPPRGPEPTQLDLPLEVNTPRTLMEYADATYYEDDDKD